MAQGRGHTGSYPRQPASLVFLGDPACHPLPVHLSLPLPTTVISHLTLACDNLVVLGSAAVKGFKFNSISL